VPEVQSVLRDASETLGAENLKSIEFSGSGYDFVLGQNANPDLPWPKFNNETYAEAIDFEAPALRMQRVRTQGENPPHGGGQQPIARQEQTRALAPAQAAAVRDEAMMLVPYGFIRAAAAAADARAARETVDGKSYIIVTFTGSNKASVNGYFNDDNVLERVQTTVDQAVLGDIPFETSFSDYKDFAGVKFPTHIVQKQGGHPVLDLTIADVKPNAPVAIGESVAPPPTPGAPPSLPSEKLGDGVFLLPGRYTAVALDFGDYTTVIEGGQSDTRSLQVIEETKKLIPNQPIRFVVNTHSHVDHAGGLRAYVAEGATVVTHEMNVPFYQKVWKNPHTLNPDVLAKNPKEPAFEPVGEMKVMMGGGQTVELYHLQNSGHHEGMLIAFLPKQKVLIEADVYNPPAQPLKATPASISPYNVSLLENIERLKLDVRKIISIHYPADSRNVTMAELRMAVGR
jgi:glyoxylase-like metal-dependent hydrolase (beta-lactamase superfamily II)